MVRTPTNRRDIGLGSAQKGLPRAQIHRRSHGRDHPRDDPVGGNCWELPICPPASWGEGALSRRAPGSGAYPDFGRDWPQLGKSQQCRWPCLCCPLHAIRSDSQWRGVAGGRRGRGDIRQVSMDSPSCPRRQMTVAPQGDGTICSKRQQGGRS